MHIPDGYLSPATCAAGIAVAAPAVALACRRLSGRLGGQTVPRMAMGAVAGFLIMMLNIPVPGGTSAHAVGAVLVAIWTGPAAAIVAITIALTLQALVFGDGGLLALGVNITNMAVIMPLAGYAAYRLIAGPAPSRWRHTAAAAGGGYLGINIAALAVAVELGIQPDLAHAADGAPLYCPWGLAQTLPAMAAAHLLIAGPVEAVVTAAAAAGAIGQNQPRRSRRGWIPLGLLTAATPLGLLAGGTAFGEWSPDEIAALRGSVPAGLNRLAGLWSHAPAGDYQLAGLPPVAGYLACALAGGAAAAGLAAAAGRLLRRRQTAWTEPVSRAAGLPGWMAGDNPPGPTPRRGPGFLEATLTRLAGLAGERRPDRIPPAPGLRLAVIVAGLIGIAVVRSPWVLTAGVAATILAAVGQNRGRRLASVMVPAALLAAAMSLPAALTVVRPGPVAVGLWPGGGLTGAGLTATWRLAARTAASIGLVVGAVPLHLDDLARLPLPRAISMTLSMAGRYLAGAARRLADLLQARRARTITAAGLAADHTWIGTTAAGLITSSTAAAQAISAAMTARGYPDATSTPDTRPSPQEATMTGAPILSCQHLHHAWQGHHTSLADIDLEVAAGDQIAVLGANGCGKSTLLSILDGLIDPTAGSYTAYGHQITGTALTDPHLNADFRRRVGYVLQNSDTQLFCSTVAEDLAFGCHQLGLPDDQTRRRVADILALTGLTEAADHSPAHLSGGQKKRLAIGGVLITNPQVLLLDEPTAGLDPRTTAWLVDLLADLAGLGRTLILATHDLDLAAEITSRAVVMDEDHHIAADRPTSAALAETALLETVNLIAPARRPMQAA